jgi:drug/metabolite transporter (DMT)-like permease
MISTIKGMRSHSLTVARTISFVSRWPCLPQGVGLVVVAAAIYALTTAITKKTLVYIPPMTLLTVQTIASATFFWSIVIWQKLPIRWNASLLKIASAGLLEPGLSYVLGILGLSLTSASNANMISIMEPVMTIGLAWLMLKEYVSKSLLGFGSLACVGIGLVATSEAVGASSNSLWGNGLLLLSVFFASLYAIVTANATQNLPPIVVATTQQSVALVFSLIVTIVAWMLGYESLTWNTATYFNLAIAFLSGAFGYGIAFLLYLMALRHLSASRISLYLTLIPVFGTFAAYWLLGKLGAEHEGLSMRG